LPPELNAAITKVAEDLKANHGAAVVVARSNDVNLQTIVNAINSAIGAFGSTINTGVSLNYKQGLDADMINLVNQMNSGAVGAFSFMALTRHTTILMRLNSKPV